MKTQTTLKVRFFAERGRPRKVTQINRNLSLSTADFKQAVEMMAKGKSLTKIEKATTLNLKSLRAVRRYAIENNLVERKESHSIANRMRAAKKTISMTSSKSEERVEKVEKVHAPVPDLFDLIPDSNVINQIPVEVKPKSTVTRFMSERTLTIDFKGIIMQVEIASIEVKGDTIVVR